MPGPPKGQGGRKRLPRESKILSGSFRKDREPKNIPRPAGTAECPDWLDAEAKREWERLEHEMKRLNLLTTVDRAAMAVYCQSWADYQWTVHMMKNRRNRIVKTPNGHKQLHPVMTLRRQAGEMLLRAASEFGMTPSARTRIDAIVPKGAGEGKASATGTHGNEEPVVDRLGRPI